jgi:hypothetical protein
MLPLTACAGAVEGTYKFKKLTYQEGGMSIELEVGEKFMGMMTLSEDFAKITLNQDGTVVATIQAGEEAETSTGTWVKAETGKIALTFNGKTETCDCDGKTLSMEVNGMKLVLEK